jgi:hypothetical protein
LAPNVSGKIGLYVASHDIAEIIRDVQAAGAIGFILGDVYSAYAGNNDLNYVFPEGRFGINITVVQIGNADLAWMRYLMSIYSNVTVRIGGPAERNEWLIVRSSGWWIAVQVCFSLLSAFNASLALAKLIAFMREQGPQLSVAQMCLTLEWIANVLRLVNYALDPLFLQRGVLDAAGANILYSYHRPFFIASTLLLSLYWHQMLTEHRAKVSIGLTKARIPYIVVVIIIITVEFLTSGIRAAQGGGNLLDILIIISGIAYIIVCLAVSLYFVVIGAQVLKSLREGSKITGGQSKRQKALIRKTTTLVIANAAFIWVLILSMVPAVIQEVFWNPYGFHIDLMVQDLAILIISTLQIWTFKMPATPAPCWNRGPHGSNSSKPTATPDTSATASNGSTNLPSGYSHTSTLVQHGSVDSRDDGISHSAV